MPTAAFCTRVYSSTEVSTHRGASGTEGPDGENYQIDFIMGSDFADGKGNATVYGTWREQKELRQEHGRWA